MGRQLVDLQSVKFSKSERLDHLFDTNIAQVFLDFFVHLVNFVMGQLLGILKVFYLLAVFLKWLSFVGFLFCFLFCFCLFDCRQVFAAKHTRMLTKSYLSSLNLLMFSIDQEKFLKDFLGQFSVKVSKEIPCTEKLTALLTFFFHVWTYRCYSKDLVLCYEEFGSKKRNLDDLNCFWASWVFNWFVLFYRLIRNLT